MASSSQSAGGDGGAKRKRSPSPSPFPSQRSREGDAGITTKKSASADTDTDTDEEDALEECKRRVPNNEETRILISQLRLFHMICYGLREKEEEKKERERENLNTFTPGSVSDTSTLKHASTPQDGQDGLDLQLAFSEPKENSSPGFDLSNVKMFIQAQPPPHYIREKISKIINRAVSDEERAILHKVAKKFHQSCVSIIRDISDRNEVEAEDGTVEPFQVAFRSIMPAAVKYTNHDDLVKGLGVNLTTKDTKKAHAVGDDDDANVGDDASSRRSKKPFVAAEEMAEQYQVKTPLDNLTAATALTSFVTKFSTSRSSVLSACRSFGLPRNSSPSTANPANPAMVALTSLGEDIFEAEHPFAFVEDKAYVGIKQLRESEDRTALTAAIALHGLAEWEKELRNSKLQQSQLEDVLFAPLLFFSIAIQGPIHELWVHWSTVEQGVFTCHSKLVESYNAQLLHRAGELMVKVKNIALWGSGPFMDRIVKQLGLLVPLYSHVLM